ncbi:MAG: family 43 glycosylhydrolase, partial [Actinophytocola sp.]|nr:family 43 glycosylhydrolase [Actinophytocola sp.]
MFKTGRGFKNTTSASPQGPYDSLKTSMLPEHEPSWMGRSRTNFIWRAWAPNVFAVKINGNWRSVMYFTAWHTTKKANCIGVAISNSRRVGYKFVPRSTICSPWAKAPYYYAAIDPTHYRAADGTRYLVYKTSDHNRKHWQIRAVRMNRYGTRPVSPRADRPKTTRKDVTAHMENPSILRHNRKVWMSTARGRWSKGCEYHTDIWQADKFWDGKFRFVKNLLTTNTTGLCGPGGAQVIQS